MAALILLLLLLAALTGVFWQVLKVTAITVLSLVLTVLVLVWIGVWYARRRWRRFVEDPTVQRAVREAQRRKEGGSLEARGWKRPDDELPPS